MTTLIRKLSGVALAAGLALGAAAQAQTSGSAGGMGGGMSASGSSWWAPAGGRYIGFNAGRTDYPGDARGDAYSLYTGGMWSENFGLEFGATDFGRDGARDAYGFSLSAIGRIPLSPAFGVFGRLGATYGRTEDAGAKASGWGENYGVGVDVNFTQTLTGVVQFDRTRLDFATGKDDVDMTSVGLKWRY